MGEVYKAHGNRLQRVVALKILAAEKVADGDRKRRFLVEAQEASKLNHPNIVAIYDVQSMRFLNRKKSASRAYSPSTLWKTSGTGEPGASEGRRYSVLILRMRATVSGM